MGKVTIEVAKKVSVELLRGVSTLLPQLSTSRPTLTEAQLRAVVESPATHLFTALEGPEIVGMLTLVLVQIPTGLRAHIEDVVVAERCRRRGIGTALTNAALELAKTLGAKTIDLTSRPSRVDAIRLYKRVGFRELQTTIFRLSLDPDSVGHVNAD